MEITKKKKFCLLLVVGLATGLGFLHINHEKKTNPTAHKLVGLFPQTPEEVDIYVKETCHILDEQSNTFTSVRFDDRNFENTVGKWDEIGKMLTERMIILKSLSIAGASQETIDAGENGFAVIKDYLFEKLSTNPSIPFAVISFLEKTESNIEFTPYEWNYINQLAQTLNSGWFPLLYQRKIDAMKARISIMPRQDYKYKCGEAIEKKLEVNKPCFSLLNFNVCFLPGKLPLLYGGMLPWNERVEKVAQKIKHLDADIVCLQEVFEEKSAEALFDLLKEKYAHFYLHVGPKTFGFTEGSAGLNSGLFIASKLRIDNPEYIAFEKSGIHVKRGFFNFSLSTDEGEFMHIYTTHLEAFNEFPGPELRKQQLDQILNRMKENILKTNKKVGIVLCGDLNIPLKSNEPAEFLLNEHFIDSYNKINTKVTLENRTCLDFTNIIWKAKLDLNKYAPVPEILDYAVLLKSHPELKGFDNGNCSIYTAVIPMNDEKKPFDALSDHHAEISLIQIKK